ncbi:HNH endonuclease [Labrys sp. (in: a-proteobacteria)]|uniref:HNH endonuclease n=1 Tax=Labrys sp. (in: a-proteobacteria) TaxID=1917972 RepID=UPI0039E31866
MMIEIPQSFVVREECEKATWQNGFRRKVGEIEGWAGFASTTVPGTIYLAAVGARGPWFLALDHAGVIGELGSPVSEMPGPGLARYAFESLGRLYVVLERTYQLAASLPDAPLREFQVKVANLRKSTEAERLVIQRIGQDVFRACLMDYWQCRCPLTGITDPALLRASHIVPWAQCDSDAERLDIHNGLLLSALWDAAFDRGLVTFNDEGEPQFAQALSDEARRALLWQGPLPLTDGHRIRLAKHRTEVFARQRNTEFPRLTTHPSITL